jgi:hypothetical protein
MEGTAMTHFGKSVRRSAKLLLAAAMATTFALSAEFGHAAVVANDPESQPAAQAIPATPAAGTPKIKFETLEQDFGDVLTTDHPTTVFKFTNEGTAPLKIERIVKSCSCTEPKIMPEGKTEFAPGESGEIHVGVSVKEKHGPTRVDVRVFTNDPARKDVMLYMNAKVARVVELDPMIVNFGEVRRGEKREIDLKVIGRTPDFKATYAVINYAEKDRPVESKILDTAPFEFQGQKLWATTIRFTLPPQSRTFRSEWGVRITTNDPRQPETGTKVQVQVQSEIELSSEVVQLGVLSPNSAFSTQLRLTHRRYTPFKLVKLEHDPSLTSRIAATTQAQFAMMQRPGALQMPTNNPENPYSYVVTISGRTPDKQGPFTGEFIVKTDVKGDEEFKVPFRGVIRAETPSPAVVPGTVPGPARRPAGTPPSAAPTTAPANAPTPASGGGR